MRNKATDAIRKQSREATADLSPEVMNSVATSQIDPSRILERKSDCASVRDAMRMLQAVASKSSYRVMHLRYLDEWSVEQVADSLDFSREQVWVREHRMKRKLREILGEKFERSITSESRGLA